MNNIKFSSVKFFDMSNTTYKATKTTVALFNTLQPVNSDHRGKYIWEAYKPEGTGVWAKKVYINK